MNKPIPSAARVRELLDYDPKSGLLTWKSDRSNIRAGTEAGCRKRTYILVSIDDCVYRAHQIIWLWVTGEWPANFIDHRDLDKKNNRWTNLRLANKSQNMANRGPQVNTSSGLKGAHRYRAGEKYGKPWQAGIQVMGRSIHLGHFRTAEEAHAAYCAAAQKHFGEFARAG